MSSELEESADHLDESNANSSAPEVNQSLDEKDNGLNEHAKPRRRRRGKKRKHKKQSAATCEAENRVCESEAHAESEHENHVDGVSRSWNSDEDLSCDTTELSQFSDVMIRPVNVPKAPENSTQFIMDDHNDCHFYMSFETPNPYLADPPSVDGEGDIVEPDGEDAAYRDIDYQYESPQDFDNSAYYDREFERSYKNNRFEELLRLSRSELLSKLQTLETRYKDATDDIMKLNPCSVLEQLQTKLLELQEKNNELKDCNARFTSMLHKNESVCSSSSRAETLSKSLSPSLSPDRDHHVESDDEEEILTEVLLPPLSPDSNSPEEYSDRELPQSSTPFPDSGEKNFMSERDKTEECNLAMELSVSDVKTVDTLNEVCDKNCSDSPADCKIVESKIFCEQTELDSIPVSTTVTDSGDQQTKINNTNTHVLHCQPNSIVKDDLRTLSINNSGLFHIPKQTKCFSAVSIEGGMSPSETSVN